MVIKEVELVHGDGPDVCLLAIAKGDVGQYLGRAADDGGLCVYRDVAGDHAHVVTAEQPHHVKELLADEGLDGGGVVAATVGAAGHEAEAERDEALARAGGRAQDEVVARGEVEQGLLLVGPQLKSARLAPAHKELERVLGGYVGKVLVVGPGDERPQLACVRIACAHAVPPAAFPTLLAYPMPWYDIGPRAGRVTSCWQHLSGPRRHACTMLQGVGP